MLIPQLRVQAGHRQFRQPGHSLQGTGVSLEDAMDEQKLLDWLGQPAALPGSKRDEMH
jgi:hypothetical protein